jgi:hypothetical protein
MLNLALTTFAHIIMIAGFLWAIREIINIFVKGE